MKVKLLTQKSTARGPHGAGCVVDVDDDLGKSWIANGDAEEVVPPRPKQGATRVYDHTPKKKRGGKK